MKTLRDQDTRWLSLGEAASRLGVDEATLRHWADTGRIRTFRTPGGHRRFLAADLGTLLQRETPRVEDLGQLVERRGARVLARSPAKSLRDRPWFVALDATARKRARGYGRELFGAIVRYVSEPQARRSLRAQLLAHGRRYGQEIRGAGLGPADAADAFGFFRGLVLKLVTEPRGRGGMLDEAQIRTLLDVSRLLDEVFGAILRAWDGEAIAPRPQREGASR